MDRAAVCRIALGHRPARRLLVVRPIPLAIYSDLIDPLTSGRSWTLYYGKSTAMRYLDAILTFHVDTIYACQDKKDDVKAGVKSTALLFGSRIRFILAGFAALMVLSLVVAGVLNSQGLPFHVLSIGGAVLHMARQIKSVNLDDTRSCLVAVSRFAHSLSYLS